MKILIALLFVPLLSFNAYSQVKILPINSIDTLVNYKIIMTTADWCQVCKSSVTIIQNSNKIDSLIQNEILFFSFNIESKNEIYFNNNNYKFSPNGMNTGNHELLMFFLEESKTSEISLPQFFILHNDKIIQSYNGLLTEIDWIRLIESLLNN